MLLFNLPARNPTVPSIISLEPKRANLCAHTLGQTAFDNGKQFDDCPYKKHSRECEMWERGWVRAKVDFQAKE